MTLTCLAGCLGRWPAVRTRSPRGLGTMCSTTFQGPLPSSHSRNLHLMRTGRDWRCSPERRCQEPCPGESVSACDEGIGGGQLPLSWDTDELSPHPQQQPVREGSLPRGCLALGQQVRQGEETSSFHPSHHTWGPRCPEAGRDGLSLHF